MVLHDVVDNFRDELLRGDGYYLDEFGVVDDEARLALVVIDDRVGKRRADCVQFAAELVEYSAGRLRVRLEHVTVGCGLGLTHDRARRLQACRRGVHRVVGRVRRRTASGRCLQVVPILVDNVHLINIVIHFDCVCVCLCDSIN